MLSVLLSLVSGSRRLKDVGSDNLSRPKRPQPFVELTMCYRRVGQELDRLLYLFRSVHRLLRSEDAASPVADDGIGKQKERGDCGTGDHQLSLRVVADREAESSGERHASGDDGLDLCGGDVRCLQELSFRW